MSRALDGPIQPWYGSWPPELKGGADMTDVSPDTIIKLRLWVTLLAGLLALTFIGHPDNFWRQLRPNEGRVFGEYRLCFTQGIAARNALAVPVKRALHSRRNDMHTHSNR